MTQSESPASQTADRDMALEALRGVAALIVFVWHFMLAFTPSLTMQAPQGWLGSPWFGFVHGTAAVGVFFVLSGFVLTRRFFITGDTRILVLGGLKRWFRLWPLTILSVMASWLLFEFHCYRYEEAAQLANSGWLQTFANVVPMTPDPDIWLALKQCLYLIPFRGDIYRGDTSLNTNLWTIHIELVGSLAIYAYAAFARAMRRRYVVLLFGTLCFATLMAQAEHYYVAFFVGAVLSLYAPRPGSIPLVPALTLLAIGELFLAYRATAEFFDFVAPLEPYASQSTIGVYASIVGAALIIVALVGSRHLHHALCNPVSRLLGRISFPLYVVHTMVICSIGAAVFIYSGDQPDRLLATAIVTFATGFLVSVPLAAFDVWWVRVIGRWAAKFRCICIDGATHVRNTPDTAKLKGLRFFT